MTTAPVPLPAGINPSSGLRLRRQSGRPVPMYLDAGKTDGPIYWLTYSMLSGGTLYADVNTYELVIEPPGGTVEVVQVVVGSGSTPALDIGDLITLDDLTAILTGERTASDAAYARKTSDETIPGLWDFEQLPTVNGVPITGVAGGVTTGQMSTAISDALTAEVSRANGAYPSRTGAATITGAWDFTTAPTVNGEPLGTGTGGGGGTISLDGYATVQYVDEQVTAVGARPAVAVNAAGQFADLLWIEPGQTAPPPPTATRRYDIELVEVTV